MRKLFLSLLMCLSGATIGYAVPAYPYPEKVMQPDGSYVTVRLVGDEYMNYSTTDDGYTIIKNDNGYYVYALEDDGRLIPSSHVAQDESKRNTLDKIFLNGISKNLHPAMTDDAVKMRSAVKSMEARPLLHGGGKYDISNFRGLIILVEYEDCPFSRDDIRDLFDDMVNKKDYDGFMSSSLIPEKIPYTGSVRDYYYDNSMGQFDPQFDVVGPIKINYSKYYARSTQYAQALMSAACKAADEQVNFADYDRDGDKTVDMVYFIFSGHGANFSGNDDKLLWPHASTMLGLRLDGVTLGRYACSTELYGRENTQIIDGIGTICHEFSHVLGLPDEYDTDYSSSGGQSIHPNRWSVMAGGSYQNNSRTPVGYTLYERYSLGFATPKLIDGAGNFEIGAVNVANTGYRINSSIKNEYFLIENRQQTGWDAYLPGHGMTVMRVDSTNVDVWEKNAINCNPAHNYLELLRATPNTKSSGTTTTVTDSQGDPFPGSGNVTAISNETSPSLRSWTGTASPVIITNIAENGDGIISFSTVAEDVPTDFEDFETMNFTSGADTIAEGRFCKWSLSGKAAVMPAEENAGNGGKAVGFLRKSELRTSVIDRKVSALELTIFNPTSSMANFRCHYSVNNGQTWVALKNIDGMDITSLQAGTSQNVIFNVSVENAMFRVMEYTGSNSDYCYVDDIKFTYEKGSGVESVMTGADGTSLKAVCNDGILSISTESEDAVSVYNASGIEVAVLQPSDGSASVLLPARGFYIICQHGKSVKVIY